jgi:hypothetical protein
MSGDLANLLGEPGKGIHTHVFGIAIADVLMVVVAALVLHWGYPRYSFWMWLAGLFVVGIVMHRLFGVRTTVDKWLFGS